MGISTGLQAVVGSTSEWLMLR